jgi:hypothetical protein
LRFLWTIFCLIFPHNLLYRISFLM